MSETTMAEDKRSRGLARLAEPDAASLSDREIARQLAVSQPLVSGLRRAATRPDAPERRDEAGESAAAARDNERGDGDNDAGVDDNDAGTGDNAQRGAVEPPTLA